MGMSRILLLEVLFCAVILQAYLGDAVRQKREDDDETVYGTLPATTTEDPAKPWGAKGGKDARELDPKPIIHMNKKQKDTFVKKLKKANPQLKKRLLKFMYKQREDDIAELKEKLGPDGEWPTKAPRSPAEGDQDDAKKHDDAAKRREEVLRKKEEEKKKKIEKNKESNKNEE
ncbi:unnamed protein product [Notodromas monacha]|uniref:Uncharacterized protein n=1 Tax=Notodromas monacha TaxID=399045 RepID=A0A7R9BCQ4_9CRUS|nr:unnamed protein product [Notodromas monacha]CAG0912929.1 unnamed protein product [Notodromas monacha]